MHDNKKVHAMTFHWPAEFDRLTGAYSPSTMRCYFSDVSAFVHWCHSVGIMEPFPSSRSMICAFIQDQGLSKSPETVRRRLCSIRKIHTLLGQADPTAHEDVTLAMRKIRRGKPGRPKQAKGLTRPYLEMFLAAQPDSLLGIRNRAMLSLGYDLLTRRSELVALRTSDVSWREDGTVQALIRRSKSDPFGQGRVAFSSKRSAALLETWLTHRGPQIDPLFCPLPHNRPRNQHLSVTTIKRLIKSSARAAGLPPEEIAEFSGHSMRVGAAQDLLAAGHGTAAIMRAGGWKSINVLARYLEQAEMNVWE